MSARGRWAPRPLPDAAVRLLARYRAAQREVILALRSRILGIAPRAHEVVGDMGYTIALRYGPDGGMKHAAVYIAVYSKHINLGFPAGAFLKDPADVLEGTGKAMRHVPFATVDEVAAAKWVERYVKAAIVQTGLKLSLGDGETEVRVRSALKTGPSCARMSR